MMKKFGAGVTAAAMSAAVFWSHAALSAESHSPPLSTPPGITLLDVIGPSDLFLWRSLGGPEGQLLYTFDADGDTSKATCVAECAKEFPPYIAPSGAKGFGEWSLVRRDDGKQQWAYHGKPLYYSTLALPPRATQREGADAKDEALALMDPSSAMYAPKAGWRRAAYEVEIATPPDIAVRNLPTANGYALVAPRSGMTMYVFSAAPADMSLWTPVYAPTLATAVGDFAVIRREDGKRQWAYKDRPLFTFRKDYTPGDIEGVVAQRGVEVALVNRHFMPAALKIENVPLLGPTMVTDKGMSVYTQTRYRTFYGGRSTRNGFWYTYSDAKAVGTRGCVDECLKMWKPVVAPRNAVGSGYWEVSLRPDGVKQWAYKGAALYTYAEDKRPGDDNGNNRHEIIFGDVEGKIDLSLTGGDRRGASGSGFYWRLVAFFN